MRQQRPILSVDKFLSGQPASALNKPAFNLALIKRWINGMTSVMKNICA